MPALAITLNQLAAALLGAGAYIYHTGQRGGWNACAIVCGTRIERSSPDPYAALAAVAATLVEYEAQQAAQDGHDSPAARAAYRQVWAATEGQPVLARFAAAEAAAAATEAANCARCAGTGRLHAYIYPFEQGRELTSVACPNCYGTGKSHDKPAAWPSTIRTEQDNARTMQRLRSITGRPSAAQAAAAASGDEQPADDDEDDCGGCEVCDGTGRIGRKLCPECADLDDYENY